MHRAHAAGLFQALPERLPGELAEQAKFAVMGPENLTQELEDGENLLSVTDAFFESWSN